MLYFFPGHAEGLREPTLPTIQCMPEIKVIKWIKANNTDREPHLNASIRFQPVQLLKPKAEATFFCGKKLSVKVAR